MPFIRDKKSFEGNLPPTGLHAATILEVTVSEGEAAKYLIIAYHLDEIDRVVTDLKTIDAEENSEKYADVGEGIQRVEELCKATGTDPESLEDDDDAVNAFQGERVCVSLVLRKKNGIKKPAIKAVLPLSKAQAQAQAQAQAPAKAETTEE